MTENKRYTTDNGSNEDVCLVDNVTGKEFESEFDEIVDLLNEQDTEIQRLKLIINGLNYALKNIRQIDVEIDLNECGDVE